LHSIEKIVIIGAGSLATNLAVALFNNGFQILQIANRTLSNAFELAKKVNANLTADFNKIDLSADLYIIAISDNSINEILNKFNLKNKLVVHTAGSIEMEAIKTISDNYGVFYPLQTFSKTDLLSFENIPICIEANSVENLNLLSNLGNKISGNVQLITSEQRKFLHISAVFSSNFSSYMYLIAYEILAAKHLSFDLLKPLILRTAEKIQTIQPEKALTGPARRNDKIVMQVHLQLLEKNPEYQEIYQIMSKTIRNHFHEL